MICKNKEIKQRNTTKENSNKSRHQQEKRVRKGSEAMDVEFIRQNIPLYVEAAFLTARIAGIGVGLSLIIGFWCGILRHYKVTILHRIATGYIELSRNTPLLIQLFFLYFGLPKLGILLSSEACAITGLAFLGGSYMAEVFRSGFASVPISQIESGLSVGLTRRQVFFHVVLPQALSVSVPAFGANVIFLIKETSVFSAVALADLMYVAKDLIGLYYQTEEALFLLVIAYVLLLLPISVACTILERRLRYAGFGN